MIWNTFPSSLIFVVFGSCFESRAVDFLARFVKKYLVALYPLFFFQSSTVLLSPKIYCDREYNNSILIITKIPLEISGKIWKILENSADILGVNFKSKRKGTPFQTKTYLIMTLNGSFFCILDADFFFSRLSGDNYWLFLEKFESSLKMNYGFQTSEGLFRFPEITKRHGLETGGAFSSFSKGWVNTLFNLNM